MRLKVMELSTVRSHLRQIFLAALQAVKPQKLILQAVVPQGDDAVLVDGKRYALKRNVYLVGFGKAVLGMAAAAAPLFQGYLQGGILSVPVGSDSSLIQQLRDQNLEVYEGARNNLPDNEAVKAAKKIKDLVISLCPDDILIVLISGGGSALLPLPKDGLTLSDKLDVIKDLVRAGATINELNIVRTALSSLKGGQLAALAGTRQVATLILSDIIGDPLHLIASGPTVEPQPENVFHIVTKYGLASKLTDKILNCVKEKDSCKSLGIGHVQNVLLGNNSKALEAAATTALELGHSPLILSNCVSGEVAEVATFYVELARNWDNSGQLKKLITQFKFPIATPLAEVSNLDSAIFICGGEPTVEVKGQGKGGRNQELALRVAKFLPEGIVFLSAGTDGIDGPTDVAGAVCDSSSIGRSVDAFLANNDSYTYFSLNDGCDFIKTGHTGTNVMDIHMLFVQRLNGFKG